jgi:hypothetical protein
MRILPFALIILASTVPLQADNLIQNGDFTDGSNHWKGDGKSSSDYANDNPSASSDPFTSKGLIIQLKPDRWTKVAQDFRGDKGTNYTLAITYKVSPDLTWSTKADDYANMVDHLRFEGYEAYTNGRIAIQVGQFFVWLGDFNGTSSDRNEFKLKPDSGDTQTIQKMFEGRLTPQGDKMITLAFPPGTGTVVILNVAVTTN